MIPLTIGVSGRGSDTALAVTCNMVQESLVEVFIMFALHPRVVDAVWTAIELLIPVHRPKPHPLG